MLVASGEYRDGGSVTKRRGGTRCVSQKLTLLAKTRNGGPKLMGRELIAVTLLILMVAGYVMLAFGLLAETFFSKRKTENHRDFD